MMRNESEDGVGWRSLRGERSGGRKVPRASDPWLDGFVLSQVSESRPGAPSRGLKSH